MGSKGRTLPLEIVGAEVLPLDCCTGSCTPGTDDSEPGIVSMLELSSMAEATEGGGRKQAWEVHSLPGGHDGTLLVEQALYHESSV